MRGRWASAALGAGVARRRAGMEMDQQARQYEAQQQDAQRTIEAQQRQIDTLQQQKQQPQQQPQSQQEDVTQKLLKYAELKKQGVLSEEEFQKLKADLLSKM
jgi:multidrug resistance efflux pump